MAKNNIKVSANVADTAPAGVAAGAKQHPAWNALRTVAARVTTPLLPDDYLKLANPLWSARELRGRVVEVRRETEDSATLVIKPGWGFSFDYQPGQFVGIGLLMDGRWRWRSYSLTSSPVRGGRTITITVKAMPEGFLSTHLVGGVAPGTIVRLAAPQGNFVMPDPAPAKVLFITGGSGITPVMSMLRTLARRAQITDVVHLHSAPTESDVMFAAELSDLERGHDGLPASAALDPHSGPTGSVAARRRGARLARTPDVGVRSRGHAQFRRARLVGRRGRRCAAPGAFRRVESRGTRTRRHGRIRPQRQNRHRGRRHATDGRRRGRRRTDAFRLPDGHLPILCGGAARRARARPAYGGRTRSRLAGPDMYIRCFRGLCTGHLGFTGR